LESTDENELDENELYYSVLKSSCF